MKFIKPEINRLTLILIWRKDNAWFVYDVSVAGISLVTNYREQFNQTVRQGGFEALLDLLENKSDILVEKAKEETDNAMKQQ